MPVELLTITLASLLYVLGQIFTSTLSYVYEHMNDLGQTVLLVMNFVIPQLTLFDASSKVVHGDAWPPIALWALRDLTLYAGGYVFVFLGAAYLIFRKRAV